MDKGFQEVSYLHPEVVWAEQRENCVGCGLLWAWYDPTQVCAQSINNSDTVPLRPCPMLKLKQKIRLSDFQSRILQTVRRLQGSDFTISVQVREHPGQRDYDKSFMPTPESWEIGFYFLTIDTTILYIIIGMQ